MVSALSALTDKQNTKYHGTGVFPKGQYIPIGGKAIHLCILNLPVSQLYSVFYVSFVITPLCSNASELVSSLMFAAKKTKINSSLTFSQV